MPIGKHIANIALYLLLTGVIVIVGLEISVRALDLAAKQIPFGMAMCEPHETRIWQYQANYEGRYTTGEFDIIVKTSAQRLRDEPVPAAPVEPAPDELRVIAIGDSFTFGWGVNEEERFTEVLERKLAERYPDKKVRVLNLGHWNYTYDQQLLILKEWAARWRPHLVIQGVYAPHLVTIGHHRQIRENGKLTAVEADNIFVDSNGVLRNKHPIEQSFIMRSHLARMVIRAALNAMSVYEYLSLTLKLFQPGGREMEGHWEKASGVLRETIRYTHGMGADYLGFYIPVDMQASRDEMNIAYRLLSIGGGPLDMEAPGRRFGAIVEKSGGDFLDMTPLFQKRYTPDLYLDIDPHWSAAGHALAGQALYKAVTGGRDHV